MSMLLGPRDFCISREKEREREREPEPETETGY